MSILVLPYSLGSNFVFLIVLQHVFHRKNAFFVQ